MGGFVGGWVGGWVGGCVGGWVGGWVRVGVWVGGWVGGRVGHVSSTCLRRLVVSEEILRMHMRYYNLRVYTVDYRGSY